MTPGYENDFGPEKTYCGWVVGWMGVTNKIEGRKEEGGRRRDGRGVLLEMGIGTENTCTQTKLQEQTRVG